MGIIGYFSLHYALAGTAGAVASGGPARRALAVAIALATLPIAFVAADVPPMVRFLLALGAAFTVIRVGQLAGEVRERVSVWRRWWHVWGLVDTRLVTRTAAPAPAVWSAHLVAHLAATAAGAALVLAADALSGAAHYAVRWSGAVIVGYANFQVMLSTVRAGYERLGLRPPTMHRDPILSRSVAEFWGQRWNLVVHRCIKAYVWKPVLRLTTPLVALSAAFVASAALHFYLAAASVDVGLALVCGSFFVLQIAFIAVEKAIGVARWPSPWQRTWTAGVLLAASPLFTEPMLQAIGL